MPTHDITSLRNSTKYIDMITDSRVRDFVREALAMYGSTEKLIEANKVASLLVDRMAKRKMYQEGQALTWMDLLLASALLHNLFYDGTMISLFMAREKLWAVGEESGLPDTALEPVFQAIEGQLGEDTPVMACKPAPNSLNSILAACCWITEEREGNKKMPVYTKEQAAS